jgi:uncharacterized protein YqcC (DUF446 family)
MSFDPEDALRADLFALVDNLERVLRQLDYWAPAPPKAALLDSAAPFSVDTLSFPEWLQWQFIPRMRSVLYARAPLPGASAIYPYAELCLRDAPADVSELLKLIARLDSVLTEHSADTSHH